MSTVRAVSPASIQAFVSSLIVLTTTEIGAAMLPFAIGTLTAWLGFAVFRRGDLL